MTETKIVIDNLSLNYEGLFSAKEFYRLVDSFMQEKNYNKKEVLNTEKVESSGKFIEMEIEPYKKVSDYAKITIRVRTKMFNVKEVEVEKDGHKLRLNQGKVNLLIDGILQTDYENRWTNRPVWIFLRTIYDKFIYKSYIDQFDNEVMRDVNQLHTQLKAFFNLYRY
jgi:hypothetical protein